MKNLGLKCAVIEFLKLAFKPEFFGQEHLNFVCVCRKLKIVI